MDFINLNKILKYLLYAIVVIILCFAGWLGYIAFIPPETYQPQFVEIPDQSTFNLDEKTGWYQMEDGSEWLLTWRPHGGLLALNFVDFANDNMYPQNESEFIWMHQGDSLSVTFIDSAGSIQKFNWTDSTGTLHTALRMDNSYYNQRELSYTNGDVHLKGTLMIPTKEPIQSATIIIHGLGTSHRDNFWYLYQANYFAKNGIMILLSDKRGSGASSGEWHTASMEDFADDSIAGARKIQDLNIADTLNLGNIGFSQGGAIAPLDVYGGEDTNAPTQQSIELLNEVKEENPILILPSKYIRNRGMAWAIPKRAGYDRNIWILLYSGLKKGN